MFRKSGPDTVMYAMAILGTQTLIYDDNRLIGCQVNYIFLARICQGKLRLPYKYLQYVLWHLPHHQHVRGYLQRDKIDLSRGCYQKFLQIAEGCKC